MNIDKIQIGTMTETFMVSYIHDDLTSYCETYKKRPAIIICPGGAYAHLSPREKDPVAMPLFSAGYQVFILNYSVGTENIKKSEPEKELADCVKYIKDHTDSLNVIPEQIAVLGFSAGGHLAASLCCHWQDYGESYKPDCGVLCYPVISMGKYCHGPSRDTLCYGIRAREDYFSLENTVSDDTVPCFIWHTTEDATVPVQNSLLLAQSLSENNIPFELHLFQKGRHGLSAGHKETGPEEPGVQSWIDLCVKWLNDRWGFVL